MAEKISTEAAPAEIVEVAEKKATPASIGEDGTIKVDLRVPKEDAPLVIDEIKVDNQVETIENKDVVVEQKEAIAQDESPLIEEITNEEVKETTKQLTADVIEAVTEQKEAGIDLPENIQKVVSFINETGGSLEDYVRLNTDYASLNEDVLLAEYYQASKPHLDKEEVNFLLEDTFAYDEEIDDERDIRKKQIARKEELQKAKNYLNGLKSKYYEDIKAGSKLAPEQQKAVEFFSRYTKENEEATKIADQQTRTFLNKTDQVFSDDFKGFDYQVGEKKYRFNVKNAPEVKSAQSNINNFIRKFLNEKEEMSDAMGYHKGLFTAMNADSVAQHFYEQGKSDAMKESIEKSKNISMGARGVHEDVKSVNGWQVRAVDSGGADSKLKIKTFKHIK